MKLGSLFTMIFMNKRKINFGFLYQNHLSLKLLGLPFLLLFTILNFSAKAQEISVITSTEESKWVEDSDFIVGSKKWNSKTTIQVFPDRQFQEIDGFGGCFNELGWEALLALPEKEREKVMQDLFSPKGANFNICRMPIGASDYALSYYSFDDVPEDFTMRDFNIDRDRYIMIPYIKEALKVKKDLKIWGSPWSPPAWMKVNNHYTLKAGNIQGKFLGGNEMDPRKNILNSATAFRMEEGYLAAYALYFSKYVQAYQNEGINIASVQVQNEIAYSPQWPSCTWRAEDIAYFIKEHLGPRFEADSLETELWLGTINSGRPEYVKTVLDNADAAKYIKGIGFQWGGKNAIGAISKEYPSYRYMQTESECGNGEKNWSSAEHTWDLLYHYLVRGANSYMYWNMILDSSGKSSWGWPQNSLISINKDTKEVEYTPEFFLMKHLSHFVLLGAKRVDVSNPDNVLAFENTDGTIVIILANKSTEDRVEVLAVKDKIINLSLKPKSFNTITLRP